MNEEQIKAAKAAWQRDPETAAQALLGMSAEEVFVQAIRGCNQHKHKQGCPDANGGEASKAPEKKKTKSAGKKRFFMVTSRGLGQKGELSEIDGVREGKPKVTISYDKENDMLKIDSSFRPIMTVDIDVNELRQNLDMDTEEALSSELYGFVSEVGSKETKDLVKSLLRGDEVSYNFEYKAKGK